MLSPDREQGEFVLFCRDNDPERERWDGQRAGMAAAGWRLRLVGGGPEEAALRGALPSRRFRDLPVTMSRAVPVAATDAA